MCSASRQVTAIESSASLPLKFSLFPNSKFSLSALSPSFLSPPFLQVFFSLLPPSFFSLSLSLSLQVFSLSLFPCGEPGQVSGVAASRHPASPTFGRDVGSDLAILGENPRRESFPARPQSPAGAGGSWVYPGVGKGSGLCPSG